MYHEVGVVRGGARNGAQVTKYSSIARKHISDKLPGKGIGYSVERARIEMRGAGWPGGAGSDARRRRRYGTRSEVAGLLDGDGAGMGGGAESRYGPPSMLSASSSVSSSVSPSELDGGSCSGRAFPAAAGADGSGGAAFDDFVAADKQSGQRRCGCQRSCPIEGRCGRYLVQGDE